MGYSPCSHKESDTTEQFHHMVFPVIMYGCEIWTIKKPECQKIDVFELVLEKTLKSPLDSKEISQS